MKSKKIQLYPYWMVVPAALFILVFYILPIGMGFVLSFTNWNIKYPTVEFVGLGNYINIWKDPEFQKALLNTLYFAGIILVARNVFALLALALTQNLKTANILRSVFYLPSVLSYVVVGVIFKALFQMNGLVNKFLGMILGKAVLIDWIGNASLALPTVMLLDLWVWTGFHMMLYIAGIQAISKEYYEAAIVDGANIWQRFRNITLPLLAPTVRMSVVLTLCGGLRVFDSVKVLTNGGPGGEPVMKKRKTRSLFVLEIVMLFLSILIIAPCLMMIFGSFKTALEANHFNIKPPSEWHFENYIEVFKKGKLLRALKNSVLMVLMTVPAVEILSAVSSFVLARRKGKVAEILYTVLSMGIVVPVSIVPTIALMQALHLQQTKGGMALLYIAMRTSWSIFLLTGFVKSVPRELDEAAFIDGCNVIKLFFYIIFPLMKPVVATSVIIATMWTWNDFHLPLYFMSSAANRTLPMTVYYFYGENASQWNLVFADMMIVSIPIVILYLFCQKYIVSGMTAGAVKG